MNKFFCILIFILLTVVLSLNTSNENSIKSESHDIHDQLNKNSHLQINDKENLELERIAKTLQHDQRKGPGEQDSPDIFESNSENYDFDDEISQENRGQNRNEELDEIYSNQNAERSIANTVGENENEKTLSSKETSGHNNQIQREMNE